MGVSRIPEEEEDVQLLRKLSSNKKTFGNPYLQNLKWAWSHDVISRQRSSG